MRDLETMVRRLMQTRRTVKELERKASEQGEVNTLDAARLLVYRGALHALAWALQIDLAQFDAPPLLGLPELPTRPTLHRVDLLGERRVWLVEIPPHIDPDDDSFSTQHWSFFLSDTHARHLHAALGETLAALDDETPDATDEPFHLTPLGRRIQPHGPTAPSTQPDSASAVYHSFATLDGAAKTPRKGA